MSLFLDAMRKSGRGKKQIVDDADTDHYNDADQNTIDQNASHASTQATEYGGEPAPEYRPNQTQEGHQYKGQIIDVDDVLGLSEDAPAKTEFAPAHADSSFSNSESIGNSYTDDPPLDYPLADLAHATPDLLPEPPERLNRQSHHRSQNHCRNHRQHCQSHWQYSRGLGGKQVNRPRPGYTEPHRHCPSSIACQSPAQH